MVSLREVLQEDQRSRFGIATTVTSSTCCPNLFSDPAHALGPKSTRISCRDPWGDGQKLPRPGRMLKPSDTVAATPTWEGGTSRARAWRISIPPRPGPCCALGSWCRASNGRRQSTQMGRRTTNGNVLQFRPSVVVKAPPTTRRSSAFAFLYKTGPGRHLIRDKIDDLPYVSTPRPPHKRRVRWNG